MRATMRLWVAAVVMTLAGVTNAGAQVTPADYDRAMGLRDRWIYLTENVADPATWVDGTSRFYYRKTVKGGFQFVMVDARDLAAPASVRSRPAGGGVSAPRRARSTPAFACRSTPSGSRAASAPSRSTSTSPHGRAVCPNTPAPAVSQAVAAVAVSRAASVRCATPRFAPDNRPKRSPDGRWDAFVSNYNLVVRAVNGQTAKALSNDGSEGDAYDPESIAWSPDSAKLAAYRVRPGYRRLVHRVESSPADQVQPRLLTQLYVEAGRRRRSRPAARLPRQSGATSDRPERSLPRIPT